MPLVRTVTPRWPLRDSRSRSPVRSPVASASASASGRIQLTAPNISVFSPVLLVAPKEHLQNVLEQWGLRHCCARLAAKKLIVTSNRDG